MHLFRVGAIAESVGSRAINGAPAIPVYRLYNNRADVNHRYTTSLSIRSDMIAKGYIREGYGPLGVVMCAPQ